MEVQTARQGVGFRVDEWEQMIHVFSGRFMWLHMKSHVMRGDGGGAGGGHWRILFRLCLRNEVRVNEGGAVLRKWVG
jgi:hypothetical protein